MYGYELDVIKDIKNNKGENERMFICFNPGHGYDNMNEDERKEFDEALQELLDYAHKLLNDDSLWKKDDRSSKSSSIDEIK